MMTIRKMVVMVMVMLRNRVPEVVLAQIEGQRNAPHHLMSQLWWA
jgi:hypothetical protein